MAEHRAYAAALYRPIASAVTIVDSAPTRLVRLVIDSNEVRRRSWTPLVPDHGKLVHLFLVKAGDLGAMAHLHPAPTDSLTYLSALPALPPGRYHAFADIVRESGLAETLVSEVTVSDPGTARIGSGGRVGASPTASDVDDALAVGAGTGATYSLPDGATLTWLGASEPHAVGADAALRFSLRDARGTPLTVEPYMGMEAHAVVVRTDGAVFVHLHPAGTTSMGAQQALLAWTPADSVRGSIRKKLEHASADPGAGMGAMGPVTRLPGEFSFPYAFPSAGNYRVWVQFRHAGAVQSALFDVKVSAGPSAP
jgi:hypothetical protein